MAKNKEERRWEFKCTKCGSWKRIVQSIVDTDRAAGRLGEHLTVGAVEVEEFPC